MRFTEIAVLDEDLGMHDTESADVLWHKRLAYTNYLEIEEMICSSRYGMYTYDEIHRKQCPTCGQTRRRGKHQIEINQWICYRDDSRGYLRSAQNSIVRKKLISL